MTLTITFTQAAVAALIAAPFIHQAIDKDANVISFAMLMLPCWGAAVGLAVGSWL